jgi:hypothetical protein
MKFPFTPSPQYTAIALAYRNKALIADMVLPRMTVSAREFKWDLHTKADAFTVPSTLVGRKGSPNEVEFTATEQTSSVLDYGLDDVVPMEDIMAAEGKPGLDPLGRATEGVTDLILLDREKRVADLVFAAGTYPTGSKVTLSGTDQWSDFTNSDPVEDILAAKEGMLMAPNKCVLGSQVWYVLRRHPKILAAIFPTGSNAVAGGVVSLQQVQDLLEMEIMIGSAYINTAKPGQAATLSRIWGKHFAMFHQNPLANLRGNGITFGATAEYGTRVSGTIDEPKVGLRGAKRQRVGETVKELITAADCGYLVTNAVA